MNLKKKAYFVSPYNYEDIGVIAITFTKIKINFLLKLCYLNAREQFYGVFLFLLVVNGLST